MTINPFEAIRQDFTRALERLDEVLILEKTEIIRDSAVKRFEFTFDPAWKALKAYLEQEKGIICASPKDCLREAFRQSVLEDDPFWLDIVNLRNDAVHAYDEEIAERVYAALPEVARRFRVLLTKIEKTSEGSL